jgi:hypothetical protein
MRLSRGGRSQTQNHGDGYQETAKIVKMDDLGIHDGTLPAILDAADSFSRAGAVARDEKRQDRPDVLIAL